MSVEFELDDFDECPSYPDAPSHDDGPPNLLAENERLRHIVRVAADFRDQIHPDVQWDRVPPWTMDVAHRLDGLLAAFDESEDERAP